MESTRQGQAIMHKGQLVKIPDSVIVEADGKNLRRFDRTTLRMIPKYVALHVNPLDQDYQPLKPFVPKVHRSCTLGKVHRLWDANGVRLTEDERVDQSAFSSTYQVFKRAMWKTGQTGSVKNVPYAKKMASAMYRAMKALPQYEKLIDDNFKPVPATIEELYFAFFDLLLNQTESQVIFVRQMFQDFHTDPLGTFERIKKLRQSSGFTIINKFGTGELMQTVWLPPAEATNNDNTDENGGAEIGDGEETQI